MPAAKPCARRIVEAIQASLATITVANGYGADRTLLDRTASAETPGDDVAAQPGHVECRHLGPADPDAPHEDLGGAWMHRGLFAVVAWMGRRATAADDDEAEADLLRAVHECDLSGTGATGRPTQVGLDKGTDEIDYLALIFEAPYATAPGDLRSPAG